MRVFYIRSGTMAGLRIQEEFTSYDGSAKTITYSLPQSAIAAAIRGNASPGFRRVTGLTYREQCEFRDQRA